eukprot:scaffold8962_cov123-Cylindrotheca_fusiformis.AAC.6
MVGCSHLSDDQNAGIHENFNKALARREYRERLQLNRITNAEAGDNQPKSYRYVPSRFFLFIAKINILILTFHEPPPISFSTALLVNNDLESAASGHQTLPSFGPPVLYLLQLHVESNSRRK